MKAFLQETLARCMLVLRLGAWKNSLEPRVTRISVLASGKILIGDKTATMAEVKKALAGMKRKRDTVWYYRESGKGEPPTQAIEVFKLIVENKLPISLSTQADFSDFVDESGQALPRK